MKIKTSELIDEALDRAVAKCKPEGMEFRPGWRGEPLLVDEHDFGNVFAPSTNWAQGGLIIDREGIETTRGGAYAEHFWKATRNLTITYGTTPLIAAMRCYVASKLGDEVDIPEKLT